MSDPKQPPDPFDAPDAASMIPTMPGQSSDPADPSDVDTGMAGTPAAPPMRDPPRTEDPAALARRLAAEAKARTEDPAALARRLAAEAKAKAKANPAEDPAALARRLAAEAKAKAKAKADAPSPRTQSAQMLAARATSRSPNRSAAEVLAEARRAATAARPPAPEPAPRQAAQSPTTPPPAAPPAEAPARPRLASPTPAPERTFDVDSVVLSALRGATVVRATRVTNAAAFTAVWRAHLARAQATQDAALATTACALLALADRVGAQTIHAAEVRWGGMTHAVWIDATTQTLVATAFPADVYMAGT